VRGAAKQDCDARGPDWDVRGAALRFSTWSYTQETDTRRRAEDHEARDSLRFAPINVGEA